VASAALSAACDASGFDPFDAREHGERHRRDEQQNRKLPFERAAVLIGVDAEEILDPVPSHQHEHEQHAARNGEAELDPETPPNVLTVLELEIPAMRAKHEEPGRVVRVDPAGEDGAPAAGPLVAQDAALAASEPGAGRRYPTAEPLAGVQVSHEADSYTGAALALLPFSAGAV
jgi:hypothetical protein